MVKTKIVETTERFDENGRLLERVVREETSEDDETRYPVYTTTYTTGTNPFLGEGILSESTTK